MGWLVEKLEIDSGIERDNVRLHLTLVGEGNYRNYPYLIKSLDENKIDIIITEELQQVVDFVLTSNSEEFIKEMKELIKKEKIMRTIENE